jgi:hypothetical protein
MDTDTAKSEAGQTASTAVDKTKEVAGSASEQAGALAGAAREQAGQVRAEVADQGRQVLSQATAKLQEQGRNQAQALAFTVRGWADQTRALADGHPEEAGQFAGYARNAADRAASAASKLEERGFDGVVDDVQRFARRRPGVFLLGAVVAGFGVGRLLRSASAADGAPGSSSIGSQAVGHEPSRDPAAASDPVAAGASSGNGL